MSTYDPNISNGTCYWAQGMEAPSRYIPCGNEAGGHISCCESGDICLSSQACFNGQYYVTYLAGCTDPDYEDPNCPEKGGYSDQVWAGLVYCNGTSNEWVACQDDGETVSKPDPCWCPSTSRTVAFTESSILTNIMSLPRSLGGNVVWQNGFGPSSDSTQRSGSNENESFSSLSSLTDRSTFMTAFVTSQSSIVTSANTIATSSSSSSSGYSKPPGEKLSKSAKIGLGIGATVSIVSFFFLIAWWILRHRSKKQSTPMSQDDLDTGLTNDQETKSPTITDDGELRSPAWSGHKSELPADESVTLTSIPTHHNRWTSPNQVPELAGQPITKDLRAKRRKSVHNIPYPKDNVYEMPG